ncbi:MAG: hypothetical protein VKK62_08355 [Synechococcaceae cyanobacterium]|nr:hypothetical protein [Synechococcaceae cyanobacterium]
MTDLRPTAALREGSPKRPWRPAVSLLLLGLLGAPAAVLGQQNSRGGSLQMNLDPAQKQQLFEQQKQLQLRHQRDRLRLLQTSERCVSAATSSEQLRSCKREERQANMQLRSRHRDELRAMLQRYGITLPERGQGQRGGRSGGGGRWRDGAGAPGTAL